jgi:ABC-2 type transport system ATP-binding protein
MYSIEVKGLTKIFGKFRAVDDIFFNVKRGEIFGFLGANGAGKSTTIRMLCGILEPTAGDALVDGFSIKNEPDKVKRSIGYMSQRFSLYNDLTVEENINFYGGVYGLAGKQLEERKNWVLKTADLEGRKDIITGSLPGGIKQRLALGTAVIHKPGIVFLDEPTSGVDPVSRRNFWELINELSSEGITILVTTHYLEEAEFCNNIIMINAGKIIAEGNPKELKTNYLTSNIFELETDNTIRTVELLQNQYFTEDISIFGNYIHLHVNNWYKSTEQISEILEANSIKLYRKEKIVPTLEDVFIHLLEKENRS